MGGRSCYRSRDCYFIGNAESKSISEEFRKLKYWRVPGEAGGELLLQSPTNHSQVGVRCFFWRKFQFYEFESESNLNGLSIFDCFQRLSIEQNNYVLGRPLHLQVRFGCSSAAVNFVAGRLFHNIWCCYSIGRTCSLFPYHSLSSASIYAASFLSVLPFASISSMGTLLKRHRRNLYVCRSQRVGS